MGKYIDSTKSLLLVVFVFICVINSTMSRRSNGRGDHDQTKSRKDRTCIDDVTTTIYKSLKSIDKHYLGLVPLQQRKKRISDSNITLSEECEVECIDGSRIHIINNLDQYKENLRQALKEVDILVGYVQKCLKDDKTCCFERQEGGKINLKHPSKR